MQDLDVKDISLLQGERAEETTKIAQSKNELMELRDAVKKLSYSDLVRKETDASNLPETVQELRRRLDQKAEELTEHDEAEQKHKDNVPDFILSQEKNWEKLGWDEEQKKQVKEKLKTRLKLLGEGDETRVENILHMLIASGKRPQEVLSVLNDDTSWDYYLQDEGGKQSVAQLTQGGGQFNLFDNDPVGAIKYLYLQEKLGLTQEANQMNEIYLQRFVLDKEFKDALKHEFDQDLPHNLFDLAWNISYYNQDYALDGKFPVLQMQVTVNSEGKTEGRYVVNQANFVRWLRARMFERYDVFETDEVPDFYQLIKINKGQFATVDLGTMIFDKNRYFKDETGYVWDVLYNQVFIEPWALQWNRIYAVQYNNAQDNPDELVKAWQEWSRLSKFTRKVNGMSMIHRDLSLAVDYNGKDSDTKLGEAMLTMFLAYYNLADFKKLQEVLGEDSPFFTKKGWYEAIEKHAGKILHDTINPYIDKFFGEREEFFHEAFDENGNVTSKDNIKNFIKFINIYYKEVPPQDVVKVLAEILKISVRDKFKSKQASAKYKEKDEDFDDASLNYAWLKAHSWTYPTGVIARNNFPDVWGQPETRWQYTYAYRLKYMGFGGAGNPYTVPMFKKLGIPFLEGILVQNANSHYVIGYENGKEKWGERQKTPMEVMLEMQSKSAEFDKLRKELVAKLTEAKKNEKKDEIESLQKQIDRQDDLSKNFYRSLSNELEFNDNAMRVYSKNLVAKGKEVYDQIMKGQETAFDKFITHDSIFRGVSFNREAWQEAIQSKMITPLRYFFEANGATQLNMMVREPEYAGRDEEGKPIWVWKDMALGEAVLGHQVLDIPEFRQKVDELSPEGWKALQKEGMTKKGKYVVRPDGKYLINYDQVQEKKTLVYKQFILMKIAADLWAHIDRHSTDQAYNLEHFLGIIEAIKSLPGDLAGDEFDMRGNRVSKGFFSEEQMEWLRRISHTTNVRLYGKQLLMDIFTGDKTKKQASLLGESATTILRGVFKGAN